MFLSSAVKIIRNGLKYNRGLLLSLLLLCIFTVTPLLQINMILRFGWLLFIVLYYRQNKTRCDKRLRRICNFGFIYIAICVVYKLLGVSSAVIGYCLQPVLYFFPACALAVLSCRINANQAKFLFHAIALFIVINLLDSIRIFVMNPMEVAYQQLAEELEMGGTVGLNLGGSMFVNMTMFFFGIMVMAFLKSSYAAEKTLFAIYALISIIFLIVCSLKASCIIFALALGGLQYVADKGQKNISKLVWAASIFALLLYVFRVQIIQLLIDISGSERLADRLYVFVDGEDSVRGQATLDARANLWMVSVESWLKSPITFFLGIGDHCHLDFVDTASSGVGNHADFFDVLARYGILGAFFFYGHVKMLYVYLMEKFGKIFRLEIIMYFIILLGVGFTKKIMSTEEAITTFLLFPLCLMYFSGQYNNIVKNISVH